MTFDDCRELRHFRYEKVVRLFRVVDGFGPLHIIVEDGNVDDDDDHLDFCEFELNRRATALPLASPAPGEALLEWALIAMLRAMSVEAREILWQVAGGRLGDKS